MTTNVNNQLLSLIAQILNQTEVSSTKTKTKRASVSSRKRWTKGELEAVFALKNIGWTNKQIASSFRGRSAKSIEQLLFKNQKSIKAIKNA